MKRLKGYPDRKLSPANSAIKMSTGTAVFFLSAVYSYDVSFCFK